MGFCRADEAQKGAMGKSALPVFEGLHSTGKLRWVAEQRRIENRAGLAGRFHRMENIFELYSR